MLNQAERRFREFADCVPAPIWLTDGDGKPTFLNQKLVEFSGASPAGEALRDVVHGEDYERVAAALKAAKSVGKSIEARLRRSDGMWRWFRCDIAPLNSDGFVGFCVCASDITDTHTLRQNMRDEIKTLERQALDPKAAQATHDLNNVLTVIASGLRLIETEGDPARRAAVIESMRQTLEQSPLSVALPWRGAPLAVPGKPQHVRRILVVEDGDGVASVACSMLDRLGYAPLRVGNAEAAIDLLARDHDFVLVFSDIHMPGMTGTDLADKIERDWPDLPVLLTSGFSGKDFRGKRPLLAKPYGLDDLALAIEKTALTPVAEI